MDIPYPTLMVSYGVSVVRYDSAANRDNALVGSDLLSLAICICCSPIAPFTNMD